MLQLDRSSRARLDLENVPRSSVIALGLNHGVHGRAGHAERGGNSRCPRSAVASRLLDIGRRVAGTVSQYTAMSTVEMTHPWPWRKSSNSFEALS